MIYFYLKFTFISNESITSSNCNLASSNSSHINSGLSGASFGNVSTLVHGIGFNFFPWFITGFFTSALYIIGPAGCIFEDYF